MAVSLYDKDIDFSTVSSAYFWYLQEAICYFIIWQRHRVLRFARGYLLFLYMTKTSCFEICKRLFAILSYDKDIVFWDLLFHYMTKTSCFEICFFVIWQRYRLFYCFQTMFLRFVDVLFRIEHSDSTTRIESRTKIRRYFGMTLCKQCVKLVICF